jgi:hypothetical protein
VLPRASSCFRLLPPRASAACFRVLPRASRCFHVLWHTFSAFSNFYKTFSAFCTLSHLSLLEIFPYFLSLLDTFPYFLSLLDTFSAGTCERAQAVASVQRQLRACTGSCESAQASTCKILPAGFCGRAWAWVGLCRHAQAYAGVRAGMGILSIVPVWSIEH